MIKIALIEKVGGSEKSLWEFCVHHTLDHLLGFGGFLGLLGQQHGLDVGQHTALSDGHSAQEFVQLLVVAHRQLQVTGDDTGLLVVPSGVSSQLQDLSRQILQHSGQINRSTSTDAHGVVAFAEKSVNTTDGELQPCSGGASLSLCSGLTAGFTSSTHF